MYVYCVEMYIYYMYSTYILYRSICPLAVWSYPMYDEVSPLTPRKYNVLNGILCLICTTSFRNVTLT
jgi:hypothetical protein